MHGPGIDEPLALEQKGKTYYYHADGLGSIMALTDSKQKIVQDYEYDSFGNLKNQKNRIKQPYTYTAREWDRETGLYYYRARYYDAEVGRFINEDPILKGMSNTEATSCSESISGFPLQSPQELNPYVYVGNNPVNWVDPLGLSGIGIPEVPDWLKDWACSFVPALCCYIDRVKCYNDLDLATCPPEDIAKCEADYILCNF